MQLVWKDLTPDQRNEACARFMPASDVNPMRNWWLYADGKWGYPLSVKNQQEADQALALLTKDDATWVEYTNYPAKYRASAEVREVQHHVRYSNTPGGAWMLVQQLCADGWSVAIDTDAKDTQVIASRGGRQHHLSHQSFDEAMAIVFLRAHDVQVDLAV